MSERHLTQICQSSPNSRTRACKSEMFQLERKSHAYPSALWIYLFNVREEKGERLEGNYRCSNNFWWILRSVRGWAKQKHIRAQLTANVSTVGASAVWGQINSPAVKFTDITRGENSLCILSEHPFRVTSPGQKYCSINISTIAVLLKVKTFKQLNLYFHSFLLFFYIVL